MKDAETPGAAGVDALRETAPPGTYDEEPPCPDPTPDEPGRDGVGDEAEGALQVLRKGLAVTPELKEGVALTVVLAMVTSAGKLAVPVLIQQILDRGVRGDAGFRPAFVYTSAGLTALSVFVLYLVGRGTYLRLVRATENSLYGLRMRAFDHVHKLSMAEHSEQRRGALVARVTSDIETLAQFTEWGAVAWIVDTVMIVGAFGVMAFYDWRLALVALAVFAPLGLMLPVLQRRQLWAQDMVRTTVGETFSEMSETITGASIVRAYGLEERSRSRLREVIDRQYVAHMTAAKYVAAMFPLGDLFGSIALGSVAVAGVAWGPGWGLQVGELIALLFLIGLLLTPIAELSEILDRTQIAIAGWRKVLLLLDLPVDVTDIAAPTPLPTGALGVQAVGLDFAYRDGRPVLRDVDLSIPAGEKVAIVGETGSGKTTFAKLLCRLADPTDGQLLIGGVDLRTTSSVARRQAIRLVPQDGFLFDTTIGANVRLGQPGATDDDVLHAFSSLGLDWWLEDLPLGLETPVGERGGSLSVGERQIVALARAQVGDPGLLVLDEATSAVDPETERALTEALARLAEGRTTVSIAHRLSTAEAADRVIVVDAGRIVEQGSHDDLLDAGGTYSKLYASWLGSTRS